MSMDGGEIRIPVRLDTSQVADDLAAVDKEVQRLQARMVQAYNRGRLVRVGRAPRAENVEDVGGNRSAWSPEVARLDQRLGQRFQEIERAARRGATAPPPTAAQAQRQASQARLDQIARQTKPIQIDAPTSFFDKMRRTFSQARPDLFAMQAARGDTVGAGAGVARMLRALVADDPLLAGVLGVAGAGVSLGLYANQNTTAFNRQAAALASATTGGPLLGNQRLMMGLQVAALSPGFSVDPTNIRSMALSMAQGGIGRGSLVNDIKNAIMLAGPNQLPFGDVAGLTTALGTSGRMSPQSINQTFQDLQNVAHDSGVSIAQLVASMKALATTAVGSARDVGGLAAVQAAIGAGSGINAGQLLSPVLSATGGQAMQAAALLGMSQQQLLSAQSGRGGTALLYDRIAGLVRRVARGPAGINVAEEILTRNGLINPQAISSPTQFAALIQQMQRGTPQQAEQAAARLYQQSAGQRVSPEESYRKTARAMEDVTTAAERLSYGLQYAATAALNSPAYGGSLYDPRSPGYVPGGPGRRAVSTFYGATYSVPTSAASAIARGMYVPDSHGSNIPLPRNIGMIDVRAAAKYGLDPSWLIAMQARESGFNPNVRSADGGLGLAQFTDPAIGRKYLGANWRTAAMNPTLAANAQAAYFRDLLQQYGGNAQMAMAAYNGGPNWRQKADAVQYGSQTYSAAGSIDQQLQITVTVNDRTQNGVSARVDHARVVTGHKSYTPPSHRQPHR